MDLYKVTVLLTIVLVSGCSVTRNVNSAASQIEAGSTICIEVNSRVSEPDILNVIEKSIINNGFNASVHTEVPDSCGYKLIYVAYRKWDFSSFLSKANIKLYRSKRLIGSVDYQLPNGVFGGGGINPEKWASTEEKISPLMNELLSI